jgi:hypothetical protein
MKKLFYKLTLEFCFTLLEIKDIISGIDKKLKCLWESPKYNFGCL